MSKKTVYSKAMKCFQEIEVGERISAKELSNRIEVTTYQDRTKVAVFLSNQARMGRAKKSIGKDKRMYYEKQTPTQKSTASKVVRVKDRSEDTITLGEIGEGIVNCIEKLQRRIEKLEKEHDKLKEKASIFSKQKEKFKRLYQEAEEKIKELSVKQPVGRKTVRLSKALGK
jgi:hypothetical protein